jgi:hypothetical protein
MPSLKDKSISLLGSFTGSIATGANPTLFTTPAGKVTRITHIVFRDPSATAAAATNISCTGFPGTISLANLITANTGYVCVGADSAAATPQTPVQGTEIAAATAVVLTTTTGAAITVTVDVFGYTSA